MDYQIGKQQIQQFTKDAQKRGYNDVLTTGYVNERKALYRKTAPISDVAVGGAVLATAGTILYKGKAQNMGMMNALCDQLSPAINSMKDFGNKFGECIKEGLETKGVGNYLKSLGKSIANGFTGSFKLLWGVCKSVPQFAAIPAVGLLAVCVGKSLLGTAEINAKYNTLQHLDPNKK
jgi:hypothetical protein